MRVQTSLLIGLLGVISCNNVRPEGQGLNLVRHAFTEYWKDCGGGSFYAVVLPEARPREYRAMGPITYEIKNPEISLRSQEVSEADRLNGLEYSGTVAVKIQAGRMYNGGGDHRWAPWEPHPLYVPITFGQVRKLNGNWDIPQEWLLAKASTLECSTLSDPPQAPVVDPSSATGPTTPNSVQQPAEPPSMAQAQPQPSRETLGEQMKALESAECTEGEQQVPAETQRVFVLNPQRTCWTPWLILGGSGWFSLRETGNVLVEFVGRDGSTRAPFEDGPNLKFGATALQRIRFKSLGKEPVTITLSVR